MKCTLGGQDGMQILITVEENFSVLFCVIFCQMRATGSSCPLVSMVKIKELSEDLRLCIVTAYREGEGYKAISNHVKVPVPTIQSIIKKLTKYHTVKNLRGHGRKPTVSPTLA